MLHTSECVQFMNVMIDESRELRDCDTLPLYYGQFKSWRYMPNRDSAAQLSVVKQKTPSQILHTEMAVYINDVYTLIRPPGKTDICKRLQYRVLWVSCGENEVAYQIIFKSMKMTSSTTTIPFSDVSNGFNLLIIRSIIFRR